MAKSCPLCGALALSRDTRDVPYTYKGKTTVFPGVTADYCDACSEAVMELDESRRLAALMLAFNTSVNAEAVDPAFIAGVRKKLGLDQREAGRIFGGGANAFSRYEHGRARPPVALVKLLRLLDAHPEMLNEIRV